ncbi:TonB-dependent receptor [Aequorivita sp. H23M31]|uniref:TonB-dependent receptor n=1 Tax=Aequorivita ciconiae TaxID=2494375 RepID=A0A410G6V6_9FLAO|nr:TonB-dependent receptor [Aequorivita sp. H23M31]QAA82951.1 TonB-dependent receptor [Aequorivita sp. H23M31]
MKKSVLYFLFGILPSLLFSQTVISGVVKDNKGIPVMGANVYLEGTYDGSTTDDLGKFKFETFEVGKHTLLISYVSFEPYKMTDDVGKMNNLSITMREDVNSLETVTISAGTFSAGDNSKISVLKPLDIVTTASAVGDFVGALQTLPGTSTVAEDGRLFVRGGDADETQVFIDDIRVFTPYSPTALNVPTRGRYSPFLFDGITFSTGGYSAEYGQALSSVLLLNTIDEPTNDKTDISIMSVGLGLGQTKKWESPSAESWNQGRSLSVNAAYINLAPYIAIFPGRNDWKKPFEAFSGEAVFRQKFKDGLLKIYSAYENTDFELIQEDINYPDGIRFKLNNQNFYTNTSYSRLLKNGWGLFAGGSYTLNKTKVEIDEADIKDGQNSADLKLKFKKHFSNHFKLNFGIEQLLTDFTEDYRETSLSAKLGFNNNITAAFTEADIIFSRKLALKLGVRGEYAQLANEFSISPRASFAYKTAENSQISVAYGDFFQQAENEILKFDSALQSQHAQHYIINYQYAANNRIFRVEVYWKSYSDLVSYNDSIPNLNTQFSNMGSGYAKGLDWFWRDNESIRNFDYWISYSFLDTKREYKNYPTQATPPFANKHNLSVVGKYWIEDWRSQIGFSYQFASGRPYTDWNSPGFLEKKTKSYNSISLNWAYLISSQKILYASVNNVFAFRNVNGYQYANTPDANGYFASRELLPASDQFFMIGFFWTISQNSKDNQLKNL